MTRILLAIPALDQMPTESVASLLSLFSHYSYDATLKRPRQISYNIHRGSNYPHARRALVTHARDIRATHVFFVDSDMVLPKDALTRLLSHKVDFVCASYIRRYGDWRILGAPDEQAAPHHTLTPMRFVPLGCALIAISVFDRVPPPWFTFQMETEAQNDRSEDVHFCDKVRAAGVPIYLDPKLTREVGHVGVQVLRYGDTPPK